jgi:hypothetical protein
MINQVLSGHTTPETAFVVADYPYGFRLRCQIRYWIETKAGHGQRVVSQTTNPKRPGTVWNKPKASTYSSICALYLDEQNYVQHAAVHVYTSDDKLDAFAADFASALTERDQKELRLLRAMNARMKNATWTVTSGPVVRVV